MFSNSGPLGWLLVVVIAVAVVIPHFQLWKRAGHSGWWSLLMLIPIVNIISLWVLALTAWPIEGDADAAR